jgi:DNA-binding NarL/FixJ family response regulator
MPDDAFLVVDGHPAIRLAVATLLASHSRVRHVHEAMTPEQAMRAALSRRPTFVVLETRLGRQPHQGSGLCRWLKQLPEPPRVLVYSADDSPAHVTAAIAAGADSFVHKSASCPTLVDAIERTRAGQRVWVLGEHPAAPAEADQPLMTGEKAMTRREEEVLSLLLRRYTNDEIAAELCLAHQTVKNHVSSVLRKLGKRSRRELFRSGAAARRTSPYPPLTAPLAAHP